MKKTTILSLILFFIFNSGYGFTETTDVFYLDEENLQEEMQELNLIEYQIINSGLFADASQNTSLPFEGFGTFQENKTILPPFVWGCLGGPIGMVIVYVLSEKDGQATMRSFWGCLISSCIWGSFSGFYTSGF
jgi:hypothetical protein